MLQDLGLHINIRLGFANIWSTKHVIEHIYIQELVLGSFFVNIVEIFVQAEHAQFVVSL